VYIAASARDARYTRICVASIRHFYPDVSVKLLASGQLEEGLAEEMARYWNIGISDVRLGNYGWGFVKLEPLFGRPGERFMVLDSDTVFAGHVLASFADSTADFLVDDEQQSEADLHGLYYDWRKVAAVDPAARPPQFVFNSGQWFGTAGILTREDFVPLVDWSEMPPKLRHPGIFMPGDQGVMNYVLNQKAMLDGISVDRRKIMQWPGHGMHRLTAQNIADRKAPPLVIHWAGMKHARLRTMVGSDVLRYFEHLYYSRVPAARARQFLVGIKYPATAWCHDLSVRLRQRWQMVMARGAKNAS
jgi:hypothetical protein